MKDDTKNPLWSNKFPYRKTPCTKMGMEPKFYCITCPPHGNQAAFSKMRDCTQPDLRGSIFPSSHVTTLCCASERHFSRKLGSGSSLKHIS